MAYPMGEAKPGRLGVNLDRRLKLECHRSKIASDAGLLAYRELDHALALPDEVEHWSMTTLRKKLIKIGAKIVRHGRYVTFQLAEVSMPRRRFAAILRLIDGLRPQPVPT